MRVLGIGFAGTATAQRAAMTDFLSSTLGLTRAAVDGVEADLFVLPDGSAFAVASPAGMGDTDRSIGFVVDDLDGALDELRTLGVETDGAAGSNELFRYAHFVAPDGQVYELMQRVDTD